MFIFSLRKWSFVQKYVPYVSLNPQQEIMPYICYISLLYGLLKENRHVNIPDVHWGLCQCLLSLHLHLTGFWWGVAGSSKRSWDMVGSWAGGVVLRLVPQGDVAATVQAALRTTPTEIMVFGYVLPRQLQAAELTALDTLHTLIRLGKQPEQVW